MAESSLYQPRVSARAAEQTGTLLWVSVLRVAAALAVVTLHTSHFFVITRAALPVPFWWAGNVVDSAMRWCVPIFVMVTGALLLSPDREEDAATFFRKRANRVLVPLIVWSAVYLVWRAFAEGLSLYDARQALLEGTPYYHLWYLYMLPGLYLVTPFLRTYIRSSSDDQRWALVGFLLVLAGVNTYINYFHRADTQSIFTLWIPYLGYYLAGYQLRTLSFRQFPAAQLALELIGCIALTAVATGLLVARYGAGGRGLYFYDYFSGPVMGAALAIFLLTRGALVTGASLPPRVERLILTIDPATLGIYVLHPLFLALLQRLGQLDPARLNPVVGIPVVALLVFGCSYSVTAVLLRIPGLRRTVG